MTYLRDGQGKFRSPFKRIVGWTIAIILGTLVLGTIVHAISQDEIVYQVQEKIVKVKDDTPTPVLQRIAKCESSGSHYDKNGQVLISKTQDVGKYQINVAIWGKKATELKYNLTIEQDNEKFALWLYENYGSEPWIHSKKCWHG